MAALWLYGPIKKLLGALSTVFVCGARISCGRYMGANQAERTRGFFSTDLFVTGLFSLVISAMMITGAGDPCRRKG